MRHIFKKVEWIDDQGRLWKEELCAICNKDFNFAPDDELCEERLNKYFSGAKEWLQ